MNEHGEELPEYMEVARDTEPWLYRLQKIQHYYGDFVRQCFVGAAALMLLAAPFYADDLASILPFAILGAVALVAAAAMTSPWNRTVIMADAVLAGVGLVIFELWALEEYSSAPLLAFVLRQAIAITFMFAFYFSMKTFRAMLLKQIGKSNVRMDAEHSRPEHMEHTEHEESSDDDSAKAMELMAAKRKMWHDKAIYERREYDG